MKILALKLSHFRRVLAMKIEQETRYKQYKGAPLRSIKFAFYRGIRWKSELNDLFYFVVAYVQPLIRIIR